MVERKEERLHEIGDDSNAASVGVHESHEVTLRKREGLAEQAEYFLHPALVLARARAAEAQRSKRTIFARGHVRHGVRDSLQAEKRLQVFQGNPGDHGNQQRVAGEVRPGLRERGFGVLRLDREDDDARVPERGRPITGATHTGNGPSVAPRARGNQARRPAGREEPGSQRGGKAAEADETDAEKFGAMASEISGTGLEYIAFFAGSSYYLYPQEYLKVCCNLGPAQRQASSRDAKRHGKVHKIGR